VTPNKRALSETMMPAWRAFGASSRAVYVVVGGLEPLTLERAFGLAMSQENADVVQAPL
jgi:hypothetical protein